MGQCHHRVVSYSMTSPLPLHGERHPVSGNRSIFGKSARTSCACRQGHVNTARFVINVLDALAKLNGDTEISINT